jgi:hypothetical protein
MNGVLEWSGSILGMLGAALLASHGVRARWGWLCFLLANVFLIAWALRISAAGLLLQQLVFLVTSVLGMRRSGLLGSMWRHMKKGLTFCLALGKSAKSGG